MRARLHPKPDQRWPWVRTHWPAPAHRGGIRPITGRSACSTGLGLPPGYHHGTSPWTPLSDSESLPPGGPSVLLFVDEPVCWSFADENFHFCCFLILLLPFFVSTTLEIVFCLLSPDFKLFKQQIFGFNLLTLYLAQNCWIFGQFYWYRKIK